MTGISEMLILILLIAGILILPRLFKSESATREAKTHPLDRFKNLSVKNRVAVSLTIVYPVASAFYYRPWEKNLTPFLLCGILPVIIGWSLIWILSGTKNK